MTQVDLDSEATLRPSPPAIVDLTDSTPDDSEHTFSDLHATTKIDPNKSVKKVCNLVSAAFASLPKMHPVPLVSEGRRRSGSLELDPIKSLHDVLSSRITEQPAHSTKSQSVPPSPARPTVLKPTQLVPPELHSISPMVNSPASSSSPLQDAQRPFSRSEDDYSVPFPDSDLTESMSATRRASPTSLSTEELIHFTEELFRRVHPTTVEHLPPQLIAMLHNIHQFVAHNCSEIMDPRITLLNQSVNPSYHMLLPRRPTWPSWKNHSTMSRNNYELTFPSYVLSPRRSIEINRMSNPVWPLQPKLSLSSNV